MIGFIKQSAIAVAAWNVSSVVTVAQLAVAKATAPETYNWVMDFAGTYVMHAGGFLHQLGGVIWEFLNTS